MSDRIPGVFGMDPGQSADAPPGSGFTIPGPSGTDAPVPMVARIIAKVNDDWHPPAPDNTATASIEADNLADVAKLLPKGEWGQGGGSLRSERIPVGTSTDLTVELHGNLLLRLPEWTNANAASAAARAEWNRMLGKLTAHEQRHVDIAIEEFNKVSAALVGKDIDKIVPLVTDANAAAQKRQDELDATTNHGRKPGVQFGDVFLNTAIT